MLTVDKLNAGYGSFQALFDVSLSVGAGEAIAVIGPNGAGKTTLLRAISRLIDARSGELTMEGRRYNDLPAHQVVSLGIAQVPEGRRLFPRLSVEDNLKMGAFTPAARAGYRDRLDFVYSLFPKMKQRRTQLAGTMSGGEQQMCAIGRALMSRPKLLLLDEPSLGLAPLIVKQIFEVIRELNRSEGLTVFLVEQNAFHALKLAHRGYVMVNGNITMSGTGAELLKREEVRAAYLEGGRH